MNLSAVVAGLRERFPNQVSQSADVLRQHGADESRHENRPPDLVVFPESTADVSEIVRLCHENSVPVIAFGAGTGLEGHVNAVAGGVCINLSRMDDIVTINTGDLDCTVQAGVRRKQLNYELRHHGLFFPVDPGPDATIGGMAATRASGTNAVRYGTMSENVIRLVVVLPNGQVIRTRSRAKKSAAGYDLTHLFVGSEGTLGIITEVTVRLYGIPEATLVARCTYKRLEDAVATAMEAMQLGLPLARIEFLDDKQMAAVNRYSKTQFPEEHTLFFEFHGSELGVREQLEYLRAVAESHECGPFEFAERTEEISALWQARHDAYYAASRQRADAVGWATDVCVPISRIVDCITETKADLEYVSVPACIVGHLGDGNFHVVFSLDPNSPSELAELEAFSKRLSLRAISMDGTCTGEHGVGLGKKAYLEEEHGPALELMHSIKSSLDPKGIMNPGKILNPAHN